MNELLDFIERCQSAEFQDQVDKNHKEKIKKINEGSKKWRKNNPEKFKESQKKYYNTEEGRYAFSKRAFNFRSKNKCQENVSWGEKILIGRFYMDCPEGYEVDHIIPLCKDGKHRLSNLQYLTKENNVKKRRTIGKREKDLFL